MRQFHCTLPDQFGIGTGHPVSVLVNWRAEPETEMVLIVVFISRSRVCIN